MNKIIENGVKLYKFNIFRNCDTKVNHAIFAGQNIENNSYRKINLRLNNPYRNKDLKNVANLMNFDENNILQLDQVHGDEVLYLGSDDKIDDYQMTKADAAISTNSDILLMIKSADCQAVLIYDPENKAIGAVHCGWKGNIKNILGKTINSMQENIGSDPKSLLVGIGPSLGKCCSEFQNREIEFGQKFENYFFEQKGKKHVDLLSLSMDQLHEKGINPKNIELSKICTKCSEQKWFSYRREGEKSGRIASVIGTKEH